MSTNEFVFGVGSAEKIQGALRRNEKVLNGTEAQILEWLAAENNVSLLSHVVTGRSEIKPVDYLVDLDAAPFIPEGWTVKEHHQGGLFKYSTMRRVEIYLSKKQKKGVISGHDLRQELKDQPVCNANLLDFYLAHPELIPADWKGKAVFFWGTIYYHSDGNLYVRCLGWNGGRWCWDYFWIAYTWDGYSPAAVFSK